MQTYQAKQILNLILNAENPVFISDERIDGDSLGASLAMVDLLKSRGKTAPVYVTEPVPSKYRFLPHIEECTTDLSIFEKPIDIIVTFDCSDAEYVDRLLANSPSRPTVINIDHHESNPNYGDINYVVTKAPAAAAVVYSILRHNDIQPSKAASTCLLTGICFDTTIFSNSASNKDAFYISSELIKLGARTQEVMRSLFASRSIPTLRVWGAALERLKEHEVLGFVATCITRKDMDDHQITDDEVDGLSNFLHFVSNAHTLFLLRETKEGGVKVSMRSLVHDVSYIAKVFGGGGHVKAAGFTVQNSAIVCNDTGCWRVEARAKT